MTPPMLLKLRVETPDLAAGQAATTVVEGLEEPAPLAVTLFEHVVCAMGPPRFALEAYFDAPPALETINARLMQLDAGVSAATLEEVPDENWVALSQAALPPIAAGRFVVHGSHDRAKFGRRRLAIEIEAGEAFGSGHNATTTLCLEALDALARTRLVRTGPVRTGSMRTGSDSSPTRFKIGRRTVARGLTPCPCILDLGCGSGVLAIAAARVAPAARVIATDNDPIAVAIARENVRLNHVSARVDVLRASGFAHAALRAAPRFDLVLANILPGPLAAMAPAIRQALRSTGVAVLSGLLNHQAPEVEASYRAAGFHRMRRLERAGWTALVMKRK
ncbi:MAG TPA: 50S ribosomal protein L11 methyltransferase [Hyphomicrobiaceae bacterium]|nr:50S ribosomal protein L11 methyltransferase [Hyphomicrobiaceae bacterium]